MVEPDCNEEEAKILEEPQNVTSNEKISNKRIREETSDSENDLTLKKARIDKSPIEEESNSTKTDNSHLDNDVNDVVDIDQSKDPSNHSNSNDKDDKKADECSTTDDVEAIKSNITEENVTGKEKDDIQENEKDTVKVAAGESVKDDSSLEKQSEKKDQSTGDNEFDKETKKQKNKKKNEQSEIINGVELTVECVSDGDSSEESEKDEDCKPRPKTEIVREQPNDSEVDASSSEAEKSDSYKIIEAKSPGNDEDTLTKVAKKRGRKKSSSKTAAAASKSESNTEDEDYSPVAKKKIKKSPVPKKTTEAKRGRGRPRGRPPKNAVKSNAVKSIEGTPEVESGKKKESSSIEAEKQNDKKSKESKDSEKADSKTEDSIGEESNEKSDSESDESEDVKKGKRRKPSKRNIKKIESLKKYIRAAGIKVQNYATLLKGCETDAAKAKRLTEFLHENGVVGRPTLEKCNKIRIKNETLKEIQELDTSSIISESRSTRGKNARKIQNETKIETKSSPDKKASEIFKRIQAVADSDSEDSYTLTSPKAVIPVPMIVELV